MKDKIKKLDGHIQALLDCFIGLKMKYSFLHPMLFDEGVCKTYGAKKKANGFLTIRHALFYDCIQDIVKLSFDTDKRTPSAKNIIESFDESEVKRLLKKRYTEPSYKDGLSEKELNTFQSKDKANKEIKFEGEFESLKEKWEIFKNKSWVNGFQIIRDKTQSHLELKLVDGEYKQIDISKQNLKWDDPSNAINSLQEIIHLLNGLIRNADYSFENLDEQLEYNVNNYWN